jgi:hypothetical protein
MTREVKMKKLGKLTKANKIYGANVTWINGQDEHHRCYRIATTTKVKALSMVFADLGNDAEDLQNIEVFECFRSEWKYC